MPGGAAAVPCWVAPRGGDTVLQLQSDGSPWAVLRGEWSTNEKRAL